VVDPEMVVPVQGHHRLCDPLSDQPRVGVRVADALAVQHDDVGGAGPVADLFGEALDEPAVGGGPPRQRLPDRRRRRECLGDGERPLLVLALQVRPLVERRQRKPHECARDQDPDDARQDPI